MNYGEINTREQLLSTIRYVDARANESLAEIEKLAMQCITKAQELKDIDLEFEARAAYINVVNYLHKPHEVIAMFPWLLKKCDEDRERFPYEDVLWIYKWVVGSLHQYATVPKDKIDEVWKDFEQRLLDFGSGEKTLYLSKFCRYSETGDHALAEKHLKLYHEMDMTGTMDNCEDCTPNDFADYMLVKGEYEKLLEIIHPVLIREVTCHQIARYTFHMGMVASMMLGRWEDAEYYSNVSRKQIDLRMSMLFPCSSHLIYYGVTGQFIKGRNIFEKQFHFSISDPELQRFEFYTGALVFFKKMQDSGKQKVKLNLPENKLLFDAASNYEVSAVVGILERLVDQAGGALDKRNGNTHYEDYAQEIMERYGALNYEP